MIIAIRRAIIAYLGAVAILFATEFTYYKFLPASHWVKELEIELDCLPKDCEGQLLFSVQQLIYIRQTTRFEYLFALICDIPGINRENHAMSAMLARDDVRPRKSPKRRTWGYSGRLPTTEAACYLEGDVTMILPYGIRKPANEIETKPFIIARN